MVEPRIRIYLDDQTVPIAEHAPPATVSIDTRKLPDGEHRLRIEAQDSTGAIGWHTVPFTVRNGPGITVSGIREGAVVHGAINVHVNAFGAEEPFEPQRAESRTPTPVWMWVLLLVIVAWAAWYVVMQWTPPPEFANTPTYATPLSRPFG